MRCQEEEEEGDYVPGLGTREGSTLLFSTTARFCDIKQRRNCSFLTSISIAITSLTIRSSGVLLETGRVFLMRFIVGVKPIWKLAKLPIKARHYSTCPYAAFQVGGCGNVIKGTIFQIIYMLAGFICRFIDTHALQLSVYGLIYYSHI